MHKNEGRLRAVFTIAKTSLGAWLLSTRTLVMLLMIGLFSYSVCRHFAQGLVALQRQLHWAEMIFYVLNSGNNLAMTSLLFLLTMMEIPQRLSVQNFILIRTTKYRWISAQATYCLWMAIAMVVLITVLTAAFTLPFATAGSGWSENEYVSQGIITNEETLIPAYIRGHCSQIGAIALAILPLLFFWFSMALVVLVFSLYGVPLVGVMIFTLMLMGNIVFFTELFGNIPMPIDFAMLSNIAAAHPGNELEGVARVILGYMGVDLFLIGLMYGRAKRISFVF